MSRTDNTDPYWVIAESFWENHVCGHFPKTTGCDLPKLLNNKDGKRSTRCYWRPSFAQKDFKVRSLQHVPKWYVDHRYHNPMRRDARDTLRNALKDYNANGDTDIEATSRQGRSSAQWDWD